MDSYIGDVNRWAGQTSDFTAMDICALAYMLEEKLNAMLEEQKRHNAFMESPTIVPVPNVSGPTWVIQS